MTGRRLVLAGLAVATLLVHWPLERADFAYDDWDFIETNQSIRSLGGSLQAFVGPTPPGQSARALYRPLTNVSYAVDHALWGDSARGFHVTNVLLYAALVLLVYVLALDLLVSAPAAAAAALLFAVHPVHCDAVDSLAGRSELLALIFSVLSLLAFRSSRPAPHRQMASAAFYLLACLSKETGVVLPAVLAVDAWTRLPAERRATVRGVAEVARSLRLHTIVLAVYLPVRLLALGRFAPETAVLGDTDLVSRLSTMGAVYFVDLQLLIAPTVLEVDFYYQALIGILEGPTLATLVGWGGLAALGFAALALGRSLLRAPLGPTSAGDPRAAALVSLAVFFAFLLPTSHVVDFGALMAERFLFAPSLGFVLLFVICARAVLGRLATGRAGRVAGCIGVAALAIPGATLSRTRADQWRDEVALWQAAATHIFDDVRVYSNLAAAHVDRGELEAARAALERALAIEPDHRESLGNLAIVELESGDVESAVTRYRRMLELDPEDFLTWNNLGIAEYRRGRYQEAARYFERALEINPNFSLARSNLDASLAAGAAAETPQGSR